MNRPLLTVCLVLLLPWTAGAQTPDLVVGTVPIGVDTNETLYANAGTIGADGFTFEWDVADGLATGRFAGTTPGPGEEPPHFAIAWYDLPIVTPLHATVTSATDGEYSFSCAWGEQGGVPDGVVGDAAIQGAYDFGHHLSEGLAAALHLILTDAQGAWDVTFTIEWGEGVAREEGTFGGVKALYR